MIAIFFFPGKAEGVLFEDDGDGYGYTQGAYLLTYYIAELQSSVITVEVSKQEGSWKRPKRVLHVHVLLGGGAMVCLCLAYIILIISTESLFCSFVTWFLIFYSLCRLALWVLMERKYKSQCLQDLRCLA